MHEEQKYWVELKEKRKIVFFKRVFWIPKYYNWIYINKDGCVMVSETKPLLDNYGWDSYNVCNSEFIGELKRNSFGDWKESLEKVVKYEC